MSASGNQRAPVSAPVTFGTAELRPDPARQAGWTLLVDGVDQSYVDLDDPLHLAYPYVRLLARLLDLAAPAGVPLRVLHLGGGALTLPRYVAASRPGSAQVVVEHDPALVALVAQVLPLPPAAGVEVRVGDARAAVAPPTLPPRGERVAAGASYDAVVADVFTAARLPDSVAGVGFAADAARLVRPGGMFAMNLTDVPPLAFSRTQTATLRTAFGDVAVLAEAGMLRGRRAGNLVVAACPEPGGLPLGRLAPAAARDAEPFRVLHGPALDMFVGGAVPRRDRPDDHG